ncbi:hypothetical protein [Cerasicoccus maritimus]|uniref:hypothetical protein n=1 Tax=Cerasicoccus maritimus TaxID=490089 RepID=UPI0028526F41|nr:hypothetical protein [Cerasicoccus maritimus]
MDPKRIGWWLGLLLAVGLTWYLAGPRGQWSEPFDHESADEDKSLPSLDAPKPVSPSSPVAFSYSLPMSPAAAKLNDPALTARDDVANVHLLLEQMFGVWKTQRRPMSLNTEFTRALTGDNPVRIPFLPADHPAIIDGELVDRWGAPYQFHQLSMDRIEVRSAGADGRLYTEDDALYSPWREAPAPVMP